MQSPIYFLISRMHKMMMIGVTDANVVNNLPIANLNAQRFDFCV
jgi:hypothetical protein